MVEAAAAEAAAASVGAALRPARVALFSNLDPADKTSGMCKKNALLFHYSSSHPSRELRLLTHSLTRSLRPFPSQLPSSPDSPACQSVGDFQLLLGPSDDPHASSFSLFSPSPSSLSFSSWFAPDAL